jgi:acetylornithine deacetylase/succinyl-diaminopimelate desuccinylase-like protein
MLTNLDFEALNSEMLTHFTNLIRINTTNPPGNEIAAANYIARVFDKEGIAYDIIEPTEGRASIIGRIKGDNSKKPLLLMSHLDVVGVEADKWEHPPFEGVIADECLWGRGTLDCKITVVLWMMILLIVKRSGQVPKRDLIFLGAADEETGGSQGAKWIVENRYDLVDAEAALNEGGGFGIEFSGKTYYTYQTAEKGNIWLRITGHGIPGHASIPRRDNPVSRIAELIHKLNNQKMAFSVTETVRQMINTLSKSKGFPVNLAMRLILNPLFSELILSHAIKEEAVANTFRSMLRNTICPTILNAGIKVNVIPAEATAELDVRVLPGTDMDSFLSSLKDTIGPQYEIQVSDQVLPSESVLDHPLADSITKAIANNYPSASVMPLMLPGSTDGGYFRSKGVIVYGFTPLLPREDTSLVHAHNERISLESIRFALETGLDAVLDFIS